MNGKRKGWFKKKGADTVDLLTGLISCWELDETSGTNVVDANSLHDGTSVNVTVNQTGKINKAYLFNSSTDYISVADHNDFSMTSGSNDLPFSISCWVQIDSLGKQSWLVTKGEFAGNTEWILQYDNNSSALEFKVYKLDSSVALQSELLDSTSGLTINTWHHIVATYDGSEVASGLTIYFDGVLFSQSKTLLGTPPYNGMTNGTHDVFLGSYRTSASSANLTGLLDQTAIWKNRELTQTEVQTLYNSGNGLAYTSWQ